VLQYAAPANVARPSEKEIADEAGLAASTIRGMLNEFVPKREQLFPPGFKFK
jgi:hypothetical protein